MPANVPEPVESELLSRLAPIFLRYLDGIVSNPPREGLPGFTALLLCTVTGERIHNRVDEQTQISSSFEPKHVLLRREAVSSRRADGDLDGEQ